MKLINDISLKVILNFSSLIDRYAPKRFCDVFKETVGRLETHEMKVREKKAICLYVKLYKWIYNVKCTGGKENVETSRNKMGTTVCAKE